MALKKQIELRTGHVAEYWKIEVIPNRTMLTAFFEARLFKDRAASQAQKAPTEISRGIELSVTKDQLDGDFLDLVALGYNAIKTEDQFFADAEDA